MSVPELLKHFNERQMDKKTKRKQRPHTATSCSTKESRTRSNDKQDQKSVNDRGAFIAGAV